MAYIHRKEKKYAKKAKKKRKKGAPGPEQPIRVRLPKGREVLGIVEQRLGASRMRIRCMDGKTRICRVPGRLRKRLWIRENNIVIVEPWEFSPDDKGDLLYKYNPTQVGVLKKKGLLKVGEEEF